MVKILILAAEGIKMNNVQLYEQLNGVTELLGYYLKDNCRNKYYVELACKTLFEMQRNMSLSAKERKEVILCGRCGAEVERYHDNDAGYDEDTCKNCGLIRRY